MIFRLSYFTMFTSFLSIFGFALSQIDLSPGNLKNGPTTMFSLFLLASVGAFSILRLASKLKKTRVRLKKWRQLSIRSSKSAHKFIIDRIIDMRRPLQGLSGIKDLYSQADSIKDGLDFIEIADQCSRYLIRQLERLQLFSELEVGATRFDNTIFELRGCVKQAITLATEQSKNSSIKISEEYGPNLPPYVEGSELALRKILTELIDNSLRHGANSRVTVKIYMDPDSPTQFRFLVGDDGSGISATKVSEIAAPMPPKRQASSWDQASEGIGFLIIRRILEEVAGNFSVQSTSGIGTSFSFSFPEGKMKVALAPSNILEKDSAQIIALVVDDEEVTRQVLCSHLRRLKIRHDVAVNGHEAIEMVKAASYDVILMDLSMPVVDGFVASRTILNLPEQTTVPKIIVISSHCRQEDKDRCASIGVTEFLEKPVRFDSLNSCLDRLGLYQVRQHLQPSNVLQVDFKKSKNKVSNPTLSNHINFTALLQSLGDNEQMCYELLKRISRDSARALEELAIGLKDQDRGAMSKVLHRVHGELAMIHCVRGLDKLSAMQKTISSAPMEVMENQFNEIGDFIDSLCNEIDQILTGQIARAG